MASPQKSASGDIDLFSDHEARTRSTQPCPAPIVFVDSPVSGRRYHSFQLAVVTGAFAFGGFLCSLFFVDGGDDFPQPHHWLRKSYSSPVMTLSPAPPGANVDPQTVPRRPNHEDKTAALQHPRITHRNMASAPTRTDRSSFDFRPMTALRTKWTNFSGNLRDRGNYVRDQALDFGRRVRQYRLEPPRLSVTTETKTSRDDAG